MVKVYDGFTKEQLIAAAEKALKHSDADIKINEHREDGFFADRRWSVYAVLAAATGHDAWRISVNEPEPGKLAVQAVSWYGGGEAISGFVTPVSGGAGGYSTSTMTTTASGATEQRYYVSPPLYNLFFARMDYFLGLKDTWEPCAKRIDKSLYIAAAGIENGQDPLCYHARSSDPTKANYKPPK
jgi:hypothetical protein